MAPASRAHAAVARIALLLQRHEQECEGQPDPWVQADLDDAQALLEEAETLLGWQFDAREGV